jgi:RNA polymerase II subunit A-like phosphatase
MTHDANGPTVSLREAQRLERESASRLYTARKLSLIVDLDQTIVHATVDPTVGEWIAEGEAWEAAHASSSKVQSKSPDPEQAQDDEDDDEVNPNWEALKDVKRFRLAPESFAPHSREKGKNKPRVEDEGCLYYIKPREGLSRCVWRM